MSRFLEAVQNEIHVTETSEDELSETDLKKWGLKGIKLRPYQLRGVQWLTQSIRSLKGCILGDEMGLGKTCQIICLLLYAQGCLGQKGPFLVLCPLSVVDNWSNELKRLCPSMSVLCYTGNKDKRNMMQRDLKRGKHFHILLTNYETCLQDAQVFTRFDWNILVVDEAHRLKNQMSKLHQQLSEFHVDFTVLLTGTPIQNNLKEVYSLLCFIQPSVFPADATDEFVSAYKDVQVQPHLAEELHHVLQPFLLRRVKSEVALDLPPRAEMVVYHGMSALQKKYYRAILMKDLAAFRKEKGHRTRLLNVLLQLRKCVNHPYLFDGVEPEPFQMGEHLVEASGKLSLLDAMLAYLQEGGHRVLLFSQMTRMLDIIQDYLEYRGYSYERLDGSVRGEERNLAIKNFSTKDVFIFLLSTRAGGVGMNLTAADTVIFVDSDFNPHNDLQAAARAHRIGQTRAVKVIRLLGRNTVEEIIYSRAISKLRLTNTVIEEGRFSLLDESEEDAARVQLCEILKFGVDNLLQTDESTVQDVDLALILGHSQDGKWVIDEEPARPTGEEENENEEQTHMYYFEGRDYTRDPTAGDQRIFEQLMEQNLDQQEEIMTEGRTLRSKDGSALFGSLETQTRRKRSLTMVELEQRRQRREEAAAKRLKLQEQRKQQLKERKHAKKMKWWASCGYTSKCLPSVDSEGEDMEEEEEEDEEGDDSSINSLDSDHSAIHYVLGDVTQPKVDQGEAIIVHCVDDSGWWGQGGLFTALEVRTDEARKQYELAGNMDDLELGNVLLFSIDDKKSRLSGRDYLALIIAQKRDKDNNVSGIHLEALEEAFKKIYKAAKQIKASVHLPRIGHSTKGFNWYGTERLIRKHLASKGIPTFIYYYKRTASTSSKMSSSDSSGPSTSKKALAALAARSKDSACPDGSSSEDSQDSPDSQAAGLPDFMRGVHVLFYNIGATEKKRLLRYLVTYDGEDEDNIGEHVTHIVAEVESPVHIQELQDMKRQYPQVLVVTTKWLDSCFANQRKVKVSKYVHNLEESSHD